MPGATDTVIDTTRTHSFNQSPAQMLLLLLGAVVLAGGGGLLMLAPVDTLPPEWRGEPMLGIIRVVGAVGIAFFGLCLVMILWRMVSSRGPVVTISPEGIRDKRVAANLIPWSAIENISTWELNRQKIIVIAVPPRLESSLGLTRISRWSRAANRSLGADGLCITSQGLPVRTDRLLNLILAHAEAARRR